MISKFMQNSSAVTPTHVRFVFFLLTIVLFVIGAGAPSDGGGYGGG